MLTYRVEDMTCGHCSSTITKALNALDAQAKVEVDLGLHLVHIEGSRLTPDAVRAAIVDAGYTPVESASQAANEAPVARRGCCCG